MMSSYIYLKGKFNMYQDIENIKYVDCSHRMYQTLNYNLHRAGKWDLKSLDSGTNSLKEASTKHLIFFP